MSLVIRMYNKCAPQFGCQPVWHRVHHKNSIEKLLAICTVGIAPFENDLRKGGTAHKINIARCGGMVKATKNSYKRVYKPDGTYSYPKVPANLLRKKDLHHRSQKGFERFSFFLLLLPGHMY